MKKTLKRIVCLLLALVVLVSMPLDIHANAVALELGWVTWALVSYLTAVGFTFAVTGGIQALQTEVEEKVDTYYQVTGIDLLGVISQALRLKPSNNGNGNGFWFGVSAVVAITEFINWVRTNGWEESTSQAYAIYSCPIYRFTTLTEESVYTSGITVNSDGTIKNLVINSRINDITSSNGSTYQYKLGTDYYSVYKKSTGYSYSVNSDQGYPSASRKNFDTSLTNLSWTLAVPYDDPTSNRYRNVYMILLNGNEIVDYYYEKFYVPAINSSSVTSVITSPSEVSEFDVEQNQAVEIDFSIFENTATKETPQELAEAVKEQIIQKGTVPDTVVDVVQDTEIEPSPEPSPLPTPTPPTYGDVDDLGLPSLGVALQNKFPFCLPYDLGRVFEIFYAEPVAPYWEVDLFATLGNRVPFVGDTSFTIDLAEYDELGVISRWMTTIGYVLLLILITRQTTKW